VELKACLYLANLVQNIQLMHILVLAEYTLIKVTERAVKYSEKKRWNWLFSKKSILIRLVTGCWFKDLATRNQQPATSNKQLDF
jgi:hypothetical protein